MTTGLRGRIALTAVAASAAALVCVLLHDYYHAISNGMLAIKKGYFLNKEDFISGVISKRLHVTALHPSIKKIGSHWRLILFRYWLNCKKMDWSIMI